LARPSHTDVYQLDGSGAEPAFPAWRSATAHKIAIVDSYVLDAHELFDKDYLSFFGPPLDEVAEHNTELICRLLEPSAPFARWNGSPVQLLVAE
jgi:hypothetical protein